VNVGLPVSLPRLVELTGCSKDQAESLIKLILKSPCSIGVYLNLNRFSLKVMVSNPKLMNYLKKYEKMEKHGELSNFSNLG